MYAFTCVGRALESIWYTLQCSIKQWKDRDRLAVYSYIRSAHIIGSFFMCMSALTRVGNALKCIWYKLQCSVTPWLDTERLAVYSYTRSAHAIGLFIRDCRLSHVYEKHSDAFYTLHLFEDLGRDTEWLALFHERRAYDFFSTNIEPFDTCRKSIRLPFLHVAERFDSQRRRRLPSFQLSGKGIFTFEVISEHKKCKNNFGRYVRFNLL